MAQVYVIGRVTSSPELKTSSKGRSYVRFDIADHIGYNENMRTQYFQVLVFDEDAERIVRANVGKGALIWVSGSLELETYMKKDGITVDKRMKIWLDNWGYISGRGGCTSNTDPQKTPEMQDTDMVPGIDGERENLPE